MANKYKGMDLYLGDAAAAVNKIGELQECNPKFMTNSEQVITAEEAAETIGKVTSEVSFSTSMPVGGTSIGIVDLHLNQTDVTIGGLVDGKFRVMNGRIIEADVKSTTKSGVVTGSFRFRGGAPSTVGL